MTNDSDMWANLQAKPGAVVFTSTPYDTSSNWVQVDGAMKMYDALQKISDAKELDAIRCRKIFNHFADLFVQKYQGWEIAPDPKDPLNKLQMFTKDGKYMISNNYPSNDLSIIGATPEAHAKLQQELPKFTSMGSNAINMPTFYGWALGMDDIPKFISEYTGEIK